MSEEAIGEADDEVEEILAASAAMPDALGEMSLDASMVIEQIEQQVEQLPPISQSHNTISQFRSINTRHCSIPALQQLITTASIERSSPEGSSCQPHTRLLQQL